MLSRTCTTERIAGHDSLSSQGSPAYMQILCRLGCQPDHLLDGTRFYFRNRRHVLLHTMQDENTGTILLGPVSSSTVSRPEPVFVSSVQQRGTGPSG